MPIGNLIAQGNRPSLTVCQGRFLFVVDFRQNGGNEASLLLTNFIKMTVFSYVFLTKSALWMRIVKKV